MTARQFAKHRETFCLASAGSDEEFHAYLSGFDAAVAIADLAAVPAQVRKKFPVLGSGGASVDLQLVEDHGEQAKKNHYQTIMRLAERGGLCWAELFAVLHNRPFQKIDTNEAMIACRALEARYLAALEPQPDHRELTVWYGKMPESNGRENWTAILRPKAGDHMHGLLDGFCFARSEYPDRVRYEADRMRWIIGELSEKPHILAYDADLHSGYVERPDPRDEVIARLVEAADGLISYLIDKTESEIGRECRDRDLPVKVRRASAALAAAKAVQHG